MCSQYIVRRKEYVHNGSNSYYQKHFLQSRPKHGRRCRKVGCDWCTVKKYVDKADFSPPKPTAENEKTHKSKLEPYKTLIDSWLIADKKSPRKQRHTARRIHARLKEEVPGYNCCYRVVAYYVSQRKKELNLKKSENYIPLIH